VIRTVYGEAGGEGPRGWLAVAHVIKNRVDSGACGPGLRILPVIHAPRQFSMYDPGNSIGDQARGRR
jgi:spore germination cell wall hydrolase CwlJ-like protein